MGSHKTPNSADYLQAIADSTTDGLIVIGSDGRVLSWNAAAAAMFGYSPGEMVGQTLDPIIPEQYRKLHDAGVARVAGGGERHVIGQVAELTGRRKDGEEFPLELTLSAWDHDGVKQFGAIIRDISRRVAMEKELRQAENRAQAIMASANDAIVTADAKGRILSWNAAACAIFGHTEQDVVGRSLTEIIPERFRAAHDAGIQRVSTGGEHHVIGQTVELAGLHQSGKEIPIELSLSTWCNDGEVFYSGIIRDITARKKDEAKLLSQKSKLAKRARALKSLNEEVNSKNEQLQALSNKLAKYLSHQVYRNIFEGKKDVKIESYRKKLTIFFSDIQGFTELTDRVESEVLTAALNKYLNEMSKIALDHGGTIDKYIGDAIMIFFGDPESLGEKEDAIACVKMAIAMKKRLQEMRREWDVLGISKPLRVRMGINTGFCTVGNFGSEERLDYTIVGGAVNLASRLETSAPVDDILVSEDTFSLIKNDIACEPHGEITVKGIAYPVKTYTVRDLLDTIRKEHEHIKARLKGFDLKIDFQQLDYSDKLYAREMLEKAMSILSEASGDKDV
jgi:PAS domain S-box-containing protein